MLLLLLSLHVWAFSLFPFLVRHPNRTVCGDSSLSYNQYPCYPQPYPRTRAGVGQSPQDAGSLTYPQELPVAAYSLYHTTPFSCLFTFFPASSWPWRALPHYFHPQVAHPLLVVGSHCSFLHCWHRWQVFPLYSSVCLQCLQHISGRFLFSILAT